MRAFFFQRLASAAGATGPTAEYVAGEQFAPSPCDRGGMETELGSDAGIAAMAQLQRGESGEEPSLLLVESAEIELAGVGQLRVGRWWRGLRLGGNRAGFRGHLWRGGNREGLRAGSGGVTCARLPLGVRALGSEVKEAVAEFDTRQASLAGELAQGIGGSDAEEGIEFLHQESGRGFPYEVLGGGEQRAAGGEADAAEGPQAESVKAGRFRERVEAAAMGIAGDVRDCPQLAHDGAATGGTEGGEHLRHASDGLPAQEFNEGVGMELNGSHEGSATIRIVTEP